MPFVCPRSPGKGIEGTGVVDGSVHRLVDCRDIQLTYTLGYYNPMLAYGEDKAITDARQAGANGFIVVDLPPEEAISFREKCAKAGYMPANSYLQTR